MRLTIALVRIFFALLMLASAGGKLLDMPGFYGIVESYRMMPSPVVPPSAWILTLFELGLGFALLDNRTVRPASVALIPLHLFYLAGLSQALFRGLKLDNCGCFGVYWGRPLTAYTLVEDLILLLLAIALCKGIRSCWTVSR